MEWGPAPRQMYKRRARILFVSREEASLTLACGMLVQVEGEYMQGRAMHLDAGGEKETLFKWADLLVALDQNACAWLQSVSPSVPVRCWDLPEGDYARLEYLKRQLASMAGGMRMMQRMNG